MEGFIQNEDGTWSPTEETVAKVRENPEAYPDAVSDFAKLGNTNESTIRVRHGMDHSVFDRLSNPIETLEAKIKSGRVDEDIDTGIDWFDDIANEWKPETFVIGAAKGLAKAGEQAITTAGDAYEYVTGQEEGAGVDVRGTISDRLEQNSDGWGETIGEAVGQAAPGIAGGLGVARLVSANAPRLAKWAAYIAGEIAIDGATYDPDDPNLVQVAVSLAEDAGLELGVTGDMLMEVADANIHEDEITNRLHAGVINGTISTAAAGALHVLASAFVKGKPVKLVDDALEKGAETAAKAADEAGEGAAGSQRQQRDARVRQEAQGADTKLNAMVQGSKNALPEEVRARVIAQGGDQTIAAAVADAAPANAAKTNAITRGVDPENPKGPPKQTVETVSRQTAEARLKGMRSADEAATATAEANIRNVLIKTAASQDPAVAKVRADLISKSGRRMSSFIRKGMDAVARGDWTGARATIRTAHQMFPEDYSLGSTFAQTFGRQMMLYTHGGVEGIFKRLRTDPTLTSKEAASAVFTDALQGAMDVLEEYRAMGRATSLGLYQRSGRLDKVSMDKHADLNDLDFAKVFDEMSDELDKLLDDAMGQKPGTAKKSREKIDGELGAKLSETKILVNSGIHPADAWEMAEEVFKEAQGFVIKNHGDAAEIAEAKLTLFQQVVRAIRSSYAINILSNTSTILVNITSGVVNLTAVPSARIIGSAITLNGAGMQRAYREFLGQGYAMIEATKAAGHVIKTREAMLDGFNQLDAKKSIFDADWDRQTALGYAARRLYTALTDAQLASDEWIKQMRYRGVRYGRAMQFADQSNLKGAERKAFIKDYMEAGFDETGRGINPADMYEAKLAAFQREFDKTGVQGLVGKLEAVRNEDSLRGVAASITFPFVRTPYNLIVESWRYLPIAPVADALLAGVTLGRGRTQFFDEIRGARGAIAQQRALGQVALGGVMMGYAWNQIQSGSWYISGPEASQWQNAKQARENSIQPASLVIQGKDGPIQIPLSRLLPFSAPLMFMGTVLQKRQDRETLAAAGYPSYGSEADEVGDGWITDLVHTSSISFMQLMQDMPMLQGSARILDLATAASEEVGKPNPDLWNSRIQKSLGYQLAGTITPGHIRAYTRYTEPYMKDANTFLDAFLAGWPGTPRSVVGADPIKRRDMFGNPIPLDLGGQFTFGFSQVRNADNPIYAEADRLLRHPAVLKAKIIPTPRQVLTRRDFSGDPTGGAVDLTKYVDKRGKNAYEGYKDVLFYTKMSPALRKAARMGKARHKASGIHYVRDGETLAQAWERVITDPRWAQVEISEQAKIMDGVWKGYRKAGKIYALSQVPELAERLERSDRRKADNKKLRTRDQDGTHMGNMFERPQSDPVDNVVPPRKPQG